MYSLHSYDENAEQLCESAVQGALTKNADSIDACQTLVSLRISQCRIEEASAICKRVGESVLEARKVSNTRSLIDLQSESPLESQSTSTSSSSQDTGATQAPTVDFTMCTVKLLIECCPVNHQLAMVSSTY